MGLAPQIIKVSQLNRYVKAVLEENTLVNDIMVKGEITSLSYRSRSGHCYFTLSDEGARINCVMFSRYLERLPSFPQEGTLVIVRGSVTLYERDGQYQLQVFDIQSIGQGTATVDYAVLRQKLLQEGLFAPERKRPMPEFPRAVGIITSAEGAAVQDIITGMQQHNDAVKLVLYPATVQGADTVPTVLRALRSAIAEDICDVLIIARGGGASEHLAVFNDERLVRAVAACPIPVISAVGHDVDITLLDEVADQRAATPTAACRYCCTAKSVLQQRVQGYASAMNAVLEYRLEQSERQITHLSRLLQAKSPKNRWNRNRQQLEYLLKSLQRDTQHRLQQLFDRNLYLQEQLRLSDPMLPVSRGYSVTMHPYAEKPILSCRELKVGDTIETRLQDGSITSTVMAITPNQEDSHE